jgi:hypothetical protein
LIQNFVVAKYLFIYLYIFFIALEEAVVPCSSATANEELDVPSPAVPTAALCSALIPSSTVPSCSSIKDVYKLFVKTESPLSPLSPLVPHSESTVFEPKKFLKFFFKE